jgi:hypothetical protein
MLDKANDGLDEVQYFSTLAYVFCRLASYFSEASGCSISEVMQLQIYGMNL